MTTLIDLLNTNDDYRQRTGGFRTDKELRHKYCSMFYDEYLLPYKEKEINILEIGICNGGSLLLWNDYFQKATIWGADINDQTNGCLKSYSNIHTHFTDAYNRSFADSLPTFDIIFDDGPHTLSSQQSCLDLYLSKLNPGGVLFIEDIYNTNNGITLREKVKDRKHLLWDTSEITGIHDNIILAVWA